MEGARKQREIHDPCINDHLIYNKDGMSEQWKRRDFSICSAGLTGYTYGKQSRSFSYAIDFLPKDKRQNNRASIN